MRLLAIGDIHGCSKALDTLLDLVKPGSQDRLVTLGDYVDRGPDSAGVLERLIGLATTTQLIPLLGNHDQMMLEARTDAVVRADWLTAGGKQTLQSYGAMDTANLETVPARHWAFLEKCVPWHETEDHIFVHACIDPDLPMDKQSADMLRWEEFNLKHGHFSGKQVICGHTVQRTGKPKNLQFAICLDTWVYGPGWLTCLDITNAEFWQANQEGEYLPPSSINRFRLKGR